MTRPCPHCSGTGLTPSAADFCSSQATRAHETFDCLEQQGHAGAHEGSSGAWPACVSCGGVVTHASGCPGIGVETEDGIAVVTWDDAGEVTVREWVPNGVTA